MHIIIDPVEDEAILAADLIKKLDLHDESKMEPRASNDG